MKRQKSFNFSGLLHFKTTIVFLTLVVLFFASAWSALALDTGLEYGAYTGLTTQDIRVTIMKIVRVILGFVGIIALIIIIYGGYVWMTSAGNPEKIDQAKKILQNAAIGLAIIFFSFAIVSFIIRMLEGSGIIPSIPPGPPPPEGCENCYHLGGGIIESVYPVPFAKDVPRDTSIIVTFKEKIIAGTIISGASDECSSPSPCSGTIAISEEKPNVRIFKRSEGEETGTLAADQVNVTSSDGKTYVFRPIVPLGDSANKHYYTTKLTNNLIRLDTQESAFPGVNNYFSWDFEIGTALDLIPPTLNDVFPAPDNTPDSYSSAAGIQATGQITITKQPRIAQQASADLSLGEAFEGSGLDVLLQGSYSGTHEGILTVTITGGGNLTTVWPGAGFTAPADYFSASSTIDPATRRADLGYGLAVIFPDGQLGEYSGKQFTIRLRPQTNADRLQVSDKVYWFVAESKPNPAENEIPIAGDPGTTGGRNTLRDKISAKINSLQSPNILASATIPNTVSLTVEQAGVFGNFVNISSDGDWAQITPMSGGLDESASVTCRDKCDEPRNVIIRMDFSEPVMPVYASGVVETQKDFSCTGNYCTGLVAGIAGAGSLKQGDFDHITVQADLNGDGTFDDNEYIAGTFILSNQYRTVEFVSLQPCQDVPYNSCGDPIFCLPINPNLDYVKYKVTINTPFLGSACTDPNQCAGLRYEDGTMTEECINNFCGKTNSPRNIYYMKAGNPPGGIVDLAFNSFDGNSSGHIQAGKNNSATVFPYNLNNPSSSHGDDLTWSFHINNRIDIEAPKILGVSPAVLGIGQSLISPINSTFNKLLQSSTVKPGWGYRDGKCTCTNDNDCSAGQECLDVNNSGIFYCVNTGGPQEYCSRDTECSSQNCDTKRYVSLYDETSRPVGWWIANYGQDISVCLNEEFRHRECDPTNPVECGNGGICSLPDGYSNRTVAQIRHTPFLEATQYSAEVASGVRDIYQNCYVPGEGPSINICDPYIGGSGCCGVTATGDPRPYCCNGEPLSKIDWEASVCGQMVNRNFR